MLGRGSYSIFQGLRKMNIEWDDNLVRRISGQDSDDAMLSTWKSSGPWRVSTILSPVMACSVAVEHPSVSLWVGIPHHLFFRKIIRGKFEKAQSPNLPLARSTVAVSWNFRLQTAQPKPSPRLSRRSSIQSQVQSSHSELEWDSVGKTRGMTTFRTLKTQCQTLFPMWVVFPLLTDTVFKGPFTKIDTHVSPWWRIGA